MEQLFASLQQETALLQNDWETNRLTFDDLRKKKKLLQPDMDCLESYYTGKDWRADFEADEEGLLPKDLKRGVLSEDGVSNLLDNFNQLGKE